jgi:hypothetical protein
VNRVTYRIRHDGFVAVGHYTGFIVQRFRAMSSSIPQLACLVVASRSALLLVGLLSMSLLPSGSGMQGGTLMRHEPVSSSLEIWARWDSEWYLLIAERGYDVGSLRTQYGLQTDPEATAGFLPLYPTLIRALAPVCGSVGAGVIISNLALFAVVILLYRLVRLEFDGDSGEVAALASCVALLVFPSSLFLSAVYAESLYLALSLGVFYAARRNRFDIAGALGGLAALTRPFGVLLLIPVLWEWWRRRREKDTSLWSVFWVLPIPGALAGFMLFCAHIFGDPMALFHRQERWRGSLSGPWRAFVVWWQSGPVAHGSHGSILELVVAVCCIAGLVLMVRKLPVPYTLYTAAAMVLALGSTLWSFSRLAVTLFPFFVLLGRSWAEGRRCVPMVYGFVAVTTSGLLMALFANWWWAG